VVSCLKEPRGYDAIEFDDLPPFSPQALKSRIEQFVGACDTRQKSESGADNSESSPSETVASRPGARVIRTNLAFGKYQ
jgi:hypothetical protein